MFKFMLILKQLPRNLHVLVSLPILCLQMISTDTNRTWEDMKHARSWVDFVMCSDSMEKGTYHGERSRRTHCTLIFGTFPRSCFQYEQEVP